MRTPAAPVPPRAAAAVAAALLAATLLTACEGTTSALGPGAPSEIAATTGTAGTAGPGGGATAAALLGRWTRVEAIGSGALLETTFTFLSGGTGARTVVLRTALGAAISEDRQAFSWSAGAGVLLLRFPGPVGATILRAAFAVDATLAGTVLRLDGISYRRAGG